MKTIHECFRTAGLVVVGAFFLTACVVDPNYDLQKLQKVDDSVQLFSDGLSIPLGKTEAITVGDALKLAELGDVDTLIKKDVKGNYSFSTGGSYNLDDVIAQMHLEDLRNINGASFSTDVEYKIGDISSDKFKIDGKSFSYKSAEFTGLDLSGLKIPAISAPDQIIKTELYKYKPEDTDIGKKIGDVENTANILNIDDVIGQIPGSLTGDTEMPVQSILTYLKKDSSSFSSNKEIDKTISLGESSSKIADVKNFHLQSGALVKIELEALNCPFTKGQVVPDLDLDMSSLFILADAVNNKINLSNLVLKADNSWKSSSSFVISSFADGVPACKNGSLSLKGLLKLEGDVLIKDAKSTPNKVRSLASKALGLKAKMSLDGVVIDEMDITLADNVSYSVSDVSIPVDISYDLPEAVSSVEKIYFDQTKKLAIDITAGGMSNLKSIDGTKHISVIPDLEITFPDGLEVLEAVNGKVVISGKDLYDGNISQTYTVKSLTPSCSNKKLSFSGNVVAKVSAGMKGTFSSKNLPATAANDLVLTAKIACQPVLEDYELTLDKTGITRQVQNEETFSFDVEGLSEFGSFKIMPKSTPKVLVNFSIPQTSELEIIAQNLVVSIPSFIEIDGSSLSGFDAVKNSFTINGKIPQKIEIPVKSLLVTPKQGEGGKTVVSGVLSVKGAVSVSETKITKTTMNELKGKVISVGVDIPGIEAKSIALEGDFSKSLDYEGKDVVILDAEAMASIPKEVKTLDEVILDGVNALIEIKVSGLPDMQGTFVLKNTRIQMPSFILGENDRNLLILDDEIEINEGKAVIQKAQLTKLKGIQLAGVSELKGDIKFMSTLYSHKPDVDVSTLKSTIKATIKVGVGNGAQADHPGKIAVSKASAKVGYNIEERQSISFGQIPSELQAEDVNFAINPQMHLQLKTNFGAPVKGNFVLTPYIAGKALGAVTIKNIELPCSDDWNRTKVNKYAIGSKVEAAADETLIAADLSALIRRIPDSIAVAINVGIDEKDVCTIFPAAKYTCEMDYDFIVPVSFGKDFNLSLNADVDIEEGAGDVIKMSNKFSLKGSYQTTLPVGLETEIILLDPNDRVIELTEPAKLTFSPSPDGVSAEVKEFTTVLSVKNPTGFNLRKIRFKFKASASADVNLRESQYIQILDLQATLPGGININASEK